MINLALETLLLGFAGEGAFAAPARAFFWGAEPHPLLRSWPEILGWQSHKGLADAWDRSGFARCDVPSGLWPLVMQLPGKARDEIHGGFAKAWDLVEPGGMLVAAMENGAGAARFEKDLAKVVGAVHSRQKHKCRVFGARKDIPSPAVMPEGWLDAGRRKPIPGTHFVTEAGVFSATKVDPGSQLLVESLPTNLRGKVADLGAGWGYLTDALLRRCPAVKQVDLFESDSRALDCARQNLAAQEAVLNFHWHDVTTGIPGRYDIILMNPPFHTRQMKDVALGRAFLNAARDALYPGGEIWLVANRQLPYEGVLDACGLLWRQVVRDPVFKVIHAVMPMEQP